MTPVMIPNPASLIQSIEMSVNFNITMLETNTNDQHVCLLELNTLTITIVIYFTQNGGTYIQPILNNIRTGITMCFIFIASLG